MDGSNWVSEPLIYTVLVSISSLTFFNGIYIIKHVHTYVICAIRTVLCTSGTWLPDFFVWRNGDQCISQKYCGMKHEIQIEFLSPNHSKTTFPTCILWPRILHSIPTKTPQNSIAAIAPPPRTLWTQCWATPEAPVESGGLASPLASPCPPGCSAVAPHSDSPHRRVGQNAQDRHLQNEKSWDFGLLLKICLRSFKTKQFGSFGSQISERIHVPAAISTPLCHCSKVDSKCAWWATTTIMSPKLILHIPHLFQGWGSTNPPQKKMPMLEKKSSFQIFSCLSFSKFWALFPMLFHCLLHLICQSS